jgi:hypothetical protein
VAFEPEGGTTPASVRLMNTSARSEKKRLLPRIRTTNPMHLGALCGRSIIYAVIAATAPQSVRSINTFPSFFDTRYAQFASLFERAITGFSPKVMIFREPESRRTRTKLAHRDPQAMSATSTVAAKSLLGPRHVCATGTCEDWLESRLPLADGPPSNHSRPCYSARIDGP